MPSKGKYNIKSFKLKTLQSNDLKGFIYVGAAGQLSIALCKVREVRI